MKPSLYGRPTLAELVEAVREFLEGEVMAATQGNVQFHARVAVNVLKTVERELEQSPEEQPRHERRLADLGVADDAELARLVRSREIGDDRLPQLVEALRDDVRARLLVSNPAYLDHPA